MRKLTKLGIMNSGKRLKSLHGNKMIGSDNLCNTSSVWYMKQRRKAAKKKSSKFC